MSRKDCKRFSIFQPMTCGSFEAEQRVYRLLMGKSGRRWLVAVQENEADNIYVEGGKNSDGFSGQILTFKLNNGEAISLTGPWHASANALLEDTGCDVRNKCLTKGIIAFKKDGDLYSDIIFEDEDWVLGKFDRIPNKAQEYANQSDRIVYYGEVSQGGGRTGSQQPTPAPAGKERDD